MIISYLFFFIMFLFFLDSFLFFLGFYFYKNKKKKVVGILVSIPACSIAIFFVCFIIYFAIGIMRDIAPEKVPSTENNRFYEAVIDSSTDKMIQMLEAGHNPNKMARNDGYVSWDYKNPLWAILGDISYEEVDKLAYEKAKILIDYNANLTTRPFIAHLLNKTIKSEKYPNQHFRKGFNEGKYLGIDEKLLIPYLELLLDNGADINAKAYSCDIDLWDWNYRRQANKKGYTALNLAIQENAFTLVDFLIERGALFDDKTEECIQTATELSGSDEMKNHIYKIKAMSVN